VKELIAQLEQLCIAKEIQKFSPDEMVELLEDGEAVDWIVEQVLSAGAADDIQELTALLEKVAEQVAPEPLEEEGEEEEEGVEAADVGEAGEEDGEEGVGDLLDMGQLKDMQLPPGIDMKQVEKLLASPQGEMMADFGTFCQEKGVDAEGEQEGMEELLQELHEEWLQTPRESLEGKKPADVLNGGSLFPRKVETFRREMPKVGRNDPCPCGSGKKFKKCCGKAG
jgi:hypothetical protein